MHFDTIVSYTTRPKRDYETNGKEHWFLTEKEAQRILTSQTIVAYTEIGEYKYFVTKQFLEDESKNLYLIDPKGIDYLLEKFSDLREYRILYIDTDKDIRDERAKKRSGYNEEVYKARCEAEDLQFATFTRNISLEDDNNMTYKGISVTVIDNNHFDTMEKVVDVYKDFFLETCTHNILYLVVGRTCSGKDSLCNELIRRFNRS